MTTELYVLALSIVLGLVHLTLATTLVTAQRGLAWNFSSRETEAPPLTGVTGRIHRAFENYKETFPFFLAAVVLVLMTQQSGQLSQIGAWTYLAARALYVAIYGLGITVIRTMVWGVATLGIVAILVDCFV